jgi:hypothetical protein
MMNTAFKSLSWTLLWSAAAGMATAQESPPAPNTAVPKTAVTQPSKSTAQTEAGEPRADTSSAPSAGSPAPAAPAAAAPTSRTPPRASGRAPGAPGTVTPSAAAPGVATTGKRTAGSTDRLDLGTATVTGDREQPKVMYIVPWKRSDIGDLSGKPMNSLLDEALAPVDREEFKREVVYYQAVRADAAQNGASNPPAKQGEK